MRVRFAAQPFQNGYDLRDFLTEFPDNGAVTRLDIAVAWAKRSGLRIVEEPLARFRARGGRVRMVVGVDEGGATRQGLEMVLRLVDEPYVFHSPSGGTFHPKVYAVYGRELGAVLTGSQNLTAGGLIENHEAGVVTEFDPREPTGSAFLQSVVRDFIERLIDDPAVCVRLDATLLASLAADPTLRVGDEDAPWRSAADGSAGPSPMRTPVFGRSRHPLRSAPRGILLSTPPATDRTPKRSPTAQIRDPAGTSITPAGFAEPATPATVVRRWFKHMSRADAQRPNAGTNPTGHLTLTQKPHPIDHRTYFRHTFFADLPWRPAAGGGGRVEADLDVEVIVGERRVGRHTLLADHNPAYEAGQGNRTTTIHWGDALNDLFRREDHVGDIVTIERLADGATRLTITAAETGPFLR